MSTNSDIEWTDTTGASQMKTCVRCRVEKQTANFTRSRKSRDGLGSWCKDCSRNYMRGRKQDPERRRIAAKASAKRHPERRRARERVKDAVRAGRLTAAQWCKCIDCGMPARAYDHHHGYQHALEVVPVCHECHGRRSRSRGEHKKFSGRPIDGRTHDAFPAEVSR